MKRWDGIGLVGGDYQQIQHKTWLLNGFCFWAQNKSKKGHMEMWYTWRPTGMGSVVPQSYLKFFGILLPREGGATGDRDGFILPPFVPIFRQWQFWYSFWVAQEYGNENKPWPKNKSWPVLSRWVHYRTDICDCMTLLENIMPQAVDPRNCKFILSLTQHRKGWPSSSSTLNKQELKNSHL